MLRDGLANGANILVTDERGEAPTSANIGFVWAITTHGSFKTIKARELHGGVLSRACLQFLFQLL